MARDQWRDDDPARGQAYRALIALAAALALGWGSPPALAQPAPPKPLFASHEAMSVTIEAPVDQLIRRRESDDRVAGILVDPLGNRLPVSVQLRGITRRTAEVCAFPPLNIRFTAPPPAGSPFSGAKKLKLVTHCQPSQSFQKHVLLEYAAYRMYNQLTPRSFDVRLATIAYRAPGGRSIASGPAFFIEDLDDVARRNATAELRAPAKIPIADLSPGDAARYGLFQHMIANHDWSMRAGPAGEDCCHNAKLIGASGAGQSIPVPYDFDFSGFVGAPYATPPDQLGLRSVRSRKYRGYCRHNAEIPGAALAFRTARPAMEAEIRSVPGLAPSAASAAIDFLAPFFAEIADDSAVQANIVQRCLG